MNNILICLCTGNSFSPEMVQRIKRNTKITRITAILGYAYEEPLYNSDSFCILRDDCIVGSFSKYISKIGMKIASLDGNLLSDLRPFLFDLLMIFRRHEDKRAFRISPRLDDHYDLLIRQLSFWNSYLNSQRINIVLFSEVPHEGYDNIIFTLCKLKGIKTYICANYYAARTCEYLLLEDYRDMSEVIKARYTLNRKEFENIETGDIELKSETEELIRGFNKKSLFSAEIIRKRSFGSQIGYMNPLEFWRDYYRQKSEGYKNLQKKESLSRSEVIRLKLETNKDLKTIIHGYMFVLKKWRESKEFIRQYEALAEHPVMGEKYIYYALHKEPEMAVNPMGGVFFDQFLAIALLSRAVPDDWKVYVKIHPIQLQFMMRIDNFRGLKELSNVRIISEGINQKDLISNAMAVSSLTGDVIIEGLFEGIPSLVFGHGYRCSSPMAYMVRTEEDVRSAIREIAGGHCKCSEKDIRLYFKTVDEFIYIGFSGIVDELIDRLNASGQ